VATHEELMFSSMEEFSFVFFILDQNKKNFKHYFKTVFMLVNPKTNFSSQILPIFQEVEPFFMKNKTTNGVLFNLFFDS